MSAARMYRASGVSERPHPSGLQHSDLGF
jgi:hypothetical protein